MTSLDWRFLGVMGGLLLLAGIARRWDTGPCWCCAWQDA